MSLIFKDGKREFCLFALHRRDMQMVAMYVEQNVPGIEIKAVSQDLLEGWVPPESEEALRAAAGVSGTFLMLCETEERRQDGSVAITGKMFGPKQLLKEIEEKNAGDKESEEDGR